MKLFCVVLTEAGTQASLSLVSCLFSFLWSCRGHRMTSHASPICSPAWQDENQKALCKLCSSRTKTSLYYQLCVQHKCKTAPCQWLWRKLALSQPEPVQALKLVSQLLTSTTLGLQPACSDQCAHTMGAVHLPDYQTSLSCASGGCGCPLALVVWRSQVLNDRRTSWDYSYAFVRWDIAFFSCSMSCFWILGKRHQEWRSALL